MTFTSGFSSTGLPKAAAVTHAKLWALSLLLSLVGAKSTDVIYTSLPLYHGTGFLGFNSAIAQGTHTSGL